MSEESDWHAPGVTTVANAALVSAMVNSGMVSARGDGSSSVDNDVSSDVDSDAGSVTSDDTIGECRILACWDYGSMRLRHRAAGNEREIIAAKNAMLSEISKARNRDMMEKDVHGITGGTLDDVEWAPTIEELFALLDDWYAHSSTVSAFWALLDESAITLHPCGPLRFRVTHAEQHGLTLNDGR